MGQPPDVCGLALPLKHVETAISAVSNHHFSGFKPYAYLRGNDDMKRAGRGFLDMILILDYDFEVPKTSKASFDLVLSEK